MRLLSVSTGNRLRHARWENVYADWKAGKSFEEIGERFNRHPSTIIKLLKYYVARSIKRNEMKWPVDALGRRICHVAHPKSYRFDQTLTMPCADDNDEKEWCHVKARQLKNSDQAYCPICQRRGKLGLPVEVSGSFSQ